MSLRTSAQALAEITSALLSDRDTADILARLVADSAELSGGQAAGLLVRDEVGELEALSATSHRAAEMQMYQAQRDEGPCIDVIAGMRNVEVAGRERMRERWPHVGPLIAALGWDAVRAFPPPLARARHR